MSSSTLLKLPSPSSFNCTTNEEKSTNTTNTTITITAPATAAATTTATAATTAATTATVTAANNITNPIVLNNLAIERLEECNDLSAACVLLDKATKIILEKEGKDSKILTPTQNEIDELQYVSKRTHFQWSQNIHNNNNDMNSTTKAVGNFLFNRGMKIIRQNSNHRLQHSTSAIRKKSINDTNNDNQRSLLSTPSITASSPSNIINNMNTSGILTNDDKAVIMYNTALVYQLLVIVNTATPTVITKNQQKVSTQQLRSRNLYLLSQTMLRKGQKYFKSKLCFYHFFHIAILNNLGQISYDLIDYRSSEHCFTLLYNNLKYLVRKQQQLSSSKKNKSSVALLWTGFCQSDVAGMFSNTIVKSPTAAPCA